jgi:hypothetical protein
VSHSKERNVKGSMDSQLSIFILLTVNAPPLLPIEIARHGVLSKVKPFHVALINGVRVGDPYYHTVTVPLLVNLNTNLKSINYIELSLQIRLP